MPSMTTYILHPPPLVHYFHSFTPYIIIYITTYTDTATFTQLVH